MPFLTNVDISNFYSNFVNLDKQDFDIIIQEFQTNKNLIDLLSVEQKLEIHIIYLEALYQIGKYGAFLREVDDAIEDCIRYQPTNQHNQFVFEGLLFKKSSALFHQDYIKQAEYVAIELVKINPNVTLYQALLTRIFYRKNEVRFHFIKAFCLILIFSSIMIYGTNLLIIKPLTGEYLPLLFDAGFTALNAGVLLYVISEMGMFGVAVIHSKRKVVKFRRRKLRE